MARLPFFARLLAPLAVVFVLGGAYLLSFRLWQDYLATPSVSVSIPSGAEDVQPGTPIGVSITGRDTQVTAVSLTRAMLDEHGAWGADQPVPVRLAVQPLGDDGTLAGRVMGEDGRNPVLADGRYTLMLQATARQVASPLPWPRVVQVEQRVEFSTLLSPRPSVPTLPVTLRYGEPVEVKWSAPMRTVEAVASPTASVQMQLDPQEPTIGRLALGAFQEGQRYEVTIRGGVAANGVPLQRPYTMYLVAPVFPHPQVPDDVVTLRPGHQRVTIHWNIPLAELQGTVGPNVHSHWVIDARDSTQSYFELDEYAQGQTYYATITRAVGKNGAPLQQPATFAVQTVGALQLISVSPDGSADQKLPADTTPSFSFSEPIADHAAVERSISVSPPTPGHFEWPDADTVRFVPDSTFPYESTITVALKPGATVRGESGAYLERGGQVTFTTPSNKKIEVNLTKQHMYLWEGDQVVRDFAVATGVAGADTPIGKFTVEYKMEKARFKGRNPSGRTYDIPDVHWVLAFSGDYTIHGAYWRTTFGRPGSNGCVSLTDPNAKILFDWAPEGTAIDIHM